jgi:hypothetical protein
MSPTSVQMKSDSDAALAATATIQTPKATIPTETKNESTLSMIGPLSLERNRKMAWNLSTPDWQNRIRTGQSLDPAMHASGAPLAADVL